MSSDERTKAHHKFELKAQKDRCTIASSHVKTENSYI